MNNLKKIGLTALAGSLVATSAYAGALDVSGSAKVTYVSEDETEVTGNGFSISDTLSFSGGGDLDNGMSVSVSFALDGGANSDRSVKLDMGDSGAITFGGGGTYGGINKYDWMIPSAGEEIFDDMDGQANGLSQQSTANSFNYNGSFSGVGLSAAYSNDGSGNSSDKSIALTYDGLMDGLSVGAAMGEDGLSSDDETFYAKYVMGGITVAVQRFTQDFTAAATANEESDAIGVSLAVNENLSISWGTRDVDFGGSTTEQQDSGVAASYTVGGITIVGSANSSDNVGGSEGTDDTHKELGVSFAF